MGWYWVIALWFWNGFYLKFPWKALEVWEAASGEFWRSFGGFKWKLQETLEVSIEVSGMCDSSHCKFWQKSLEIWRGVNGTWDGSKVTGSLNLAEWKPMTEASNQRRNSHKEFLQFPTLQQSFFIVSFSPNIQTTNLHHSSKTSINFEPFTHPLSSFFCRHQSISYIIFPCRTEIS
jgi:hypothetical protein